MLSPAPRLPREGAPDKVGWGSLLKESAKIKEDEKQSNSLIPNTVVDAGKYPQEIGIKLEKIPQWGGKYGIILV